MAGGGGNRGGARLGRPGEKRERVGPMKNSDIQNYSKIFIFDLNLFN
jgi:hypothetical protein